MKLNKGLLLFPLLSLLFFSGCTSTSVMGLSRADHVNELEIKLNRELGELKNRDDSRINAMEEEISGLRESLGEIETMRRDLERVSAGLDSGMEETEELKRMAADFGARLEGVHRETLVLLIQALENYISEDRDQKISLSP